jgi:hypothetical protein
MAFGEAEQRAFVEIAVAMQRQDRVLRRHEITVAFDLLGRAGNLGHGLLDRRLPLGLDHLEQAPANDADRSRQQFLQSLAGQVVSLTNLER